MKKPVLAIAMVIVLISGSLLAGCSPLEIITGSGPVVTRDYDFTGFTRVEVSSAFKAELVPSEAYAVSITANENMFPYIEVAQSGDTLKIGVKGLAMHFGSVTLKAKVSMPELWGLDVSGASEVKTLGFKSSHDFDLSVSGASTLGMDIEASNVAGNISGASEVSGYLKALDTRIELSGASTMDVDMTTDSAEFELSGSSEVTGHLETTATRMVLSGASTLDMTGSAGDASLEASGSSEVGLSSSLTANDADIELTGASEALMDINGQLDLDLSGGSTLEFTGNPTLGEISISGGSEINRQ